MLVTRYLQALEDADPAAAISLFAPGGVVHSPLYGTLPATDFYPALFADTSASRLTLRRVMRADDEGTPTVAFWFDFAWVLANGDPAPFTVVDVAELDDEGRIAQLHIVYDTAPIRAAFDRQRASRPTA
ncbi:steroid delta-isomerase [Clavibacter michiganensis]|uniref:nuclear transport factor 2 family protein n=1 Tax=Clavibacter michiganensis TaxID=28447 RepID=UPI00195BE128|nr:nuclear transport factor 2 family protein [Clavibacter michiganensis]MBM7412923.1 steroid delta-isomerase [Clavibacter michiganensis]